MDVSALKNGDQIVIYRTTDYQGPAKFRSVATSICTVEELKSKDDFGDVNEYLKYCQEYSVFEEFELRSYFQKDNLFVIKMTYNAAFSKRVIRGKLIDEIGIDPKSYWGFLKLTDSQFEEILKAGEVSDSIILR